MGGQRYGGNPADHDGGQGKRSGFHTHLQGERPAHRIELAEVGTVEMRAEKPLSVFAVAGQVKEDANEDRHHQKAREEGGDARTEEAEFRQACRAVNQGVVQDDVDQVADEQNPHGRPRVHDAVGELLESVEQQDEDERAEQDEVIRLDQGDEFGRLVQVVDVEEQYGHAQYEDEGDNEIGQ